MLSKFKQSILLNIAIVLNRWLLALLLSGTCSSLWAQSGESTNNEAVDEKDVTFSEKEPSPPQVEAPTPKKDTYLSRQQLLAKELPQNTEALWLDLNGQQRLALWRADQSGQPLGAVLILHDDDRQQNQPAYLENLALILPDYGWATLSIALPGIPPAPIPPRPDKPTPPPAPNSPEGTEAAPEPVDETEVVFNEENEDSEEPDPKAPEPITKPADITKPDAEEVEANAQIAISAALRALNEKGQYNVVILGEALGAVRALRFMSDAAPQSGQVLEKNKAKAKVDKPVRAMILLNSSNRWQRLGLYLPELLTFSDIPTLDVYFEGPESAQQAKLRKQSAQRQKYQHYVVKALLPAPLPAGRFEETTLTKTVRGFLSRYAKGVELK